MKSPYTSAALKNSLNLSFPSLPREQLLKSQPNPTFPLIILYQQIEGVLMLQRPSIF